RAVGRRDQQAVVAAAAVDGGAGPPGFEVGVLVLGIVELDAEVLGHAVPAGQLPHVGRLGPALGAADGRPDAEAEHRPFQAEAGAPTVGHVVDVFGAIL